MTVRLSMVTVAALLLTGALVGVAAFGTAAPRLTPFGAVTYADGALLAVIPGYGQSNELLTVMIGDNGVFQVDFRKGGMEGTEYAVQAGASYLFRELMLIQNNDARAKRIRADVVDGTGTPVAEVSSITGELDGVVYELSGPAATPPSLAPGAVLAVSVRFSVPSGVQSGLRTYQLRVISD